MAKTSCDVCDRPKGARGELLLKTMEARGEEVRETVAGAKSCREIESGCFVVDVSAILQERVVGEICAGKNREGQFVAGVCDRGAHAAIDGTVGVGEGRYFDAEQVLEFGLGIAELPLQVTVGEIGQPWMSECMRSELDAVLLHFTNLVQSEEITRAEASCLIPEIGGADAIGDEKDDRGVAMLDNQRQQVLVEIIVCIVEGDEDLFRRKIAQ